jgi:16S rRNA (guanine527-N7)-methyltransferase
MIPMNNFLEKALKRNGHDIPAEIQEKFLHYLDLMQRWNNVFNLTAIHEMEDMIWLHLLDSLSINTYLHGTRIADVGTGAGLPGIPLALLNPEKEFVLLDSNSKKTRFLTQCKLELTLANVEVIHARCEDFQPNDLFHSIVSRAFSSIAVMLEKTEHLLAPRGQFLAMKGAYPDAELKNLPADFMLTGVHKLTIKGLPAERHLVCIEKK